MKGEWATRRERIVLTDAWCFIVASLHGWVERARPTRYRFHEAYVCIPRKSAKSTVGAGIANYRFAADGETCAEVYIGATSEEQARRLCFKFARLMALKSPEFQRAFGIKVNTHSLTKDDGAVMKPVIARLGDGDSPSCAVLEEYHEHPTDHLYQAFKQGMKARANPLVLILTTAGSNRNGPCYKHQQKCEKILAGQVKDERVFAIIFGIDPGDDPFSELALIKAQPSLGITVDLEQLLNDQRSAKQFVHEQNDFKTKQLNVWVNATIAWMNMASWDAMADPTLRIEDFEGEDCYGGLDLASRSDLAAAVKVFRRYLPDGKDGEDRSHFYVFCRAYQNREKVDRPQNKHYRDWELEGALTVTPGNVTDYNWIADDLIRDAERFRILRVPHDPDHAAALIQFIHARDDWDQNVEFVEITQNVRNFSTAMKETEALVREGRLHHDGDPLLAWTIGNVVAKQLSRDNIFPDKEDPENKIDPAVALFMAIGQWVLTGDDQISGSCLQVLGDEPDNKAARAERADVCTSATDLVGGDDGDDFEDEY